MMRFIQKISKLNYFTSVLVCQLDNGLKINMDQAGTSLKPNILIAPLDWGLGHATRCIPIINALIQKKCNVILACEGKIENLLFNEFPQINFINLKGYRIHYSKNNWSLPFHIGKQIPKIISTIQYENERLKKIVKEHGINGIISDNRYGFYHDSIPSAFITHQLRIKTGFGRIVDHYLQKLNYKYINRFSECWLPDNESESNLAGELSHPEKMPPVPTKYIGPLSRLQKINSKEEKHLLILLSGPEPQRTILENLLIRQLNDYKGSIVLVRGLPGQTNELPLSSNICVYNHLPAEELNQKINEAFVVISRCGYSTVMDLAILKKKSVLIPTPGQTEQEYLAKHLMKNNLALCIEQNKFGLQNALELSNHFNYQIQNFSSKNNLDACLEEFLTIARAK
jgi:uncharacterized protein (TIGR00661 family)